MADLYRKTDLVGGWSFEGDWLPTPRKVTLLATGAIGPRRTVLSSFNAG